MKNSEKGYTLVEFLVVIIILVSITSIIAGIVFSTLRGADRSTSSNLVSQNGNTALSVMSSIIQSSKDVRSIDGEAISDCVGSPAMSGESIELLRSDGDISKLSCTEDTIASNEDQLISDDVRVVSGSCSFACSQSSVFETPFIEISFSLFEVGKLEAQQDFGTSVYLRNFSN